MKDVQRYASWMARSVRAAGWAPLLVFGAHAVLAATGAYGVVPSIDIPMHLAGGVVIAYFFARSLALAVDDGLLGAPNRLAVALLVLACTCAAAVFWEFAEWTYDRFFLAPDARDYGDTLLDMALGIAGGSLFVAASVARHALRRGVVSSEPVASPGEAA